jgi:hypothetical protein
MFTPGYAKSTYQKTVYIITVSLLSILAICFLLGGQVVGALFWVALIALRKWMYSRATGSLCPSCKSMDYISLDTPMGKRLSGK